MVVFIYGTTGELIKLLPLIVAIPHNEQTHILTNQQPSKVSQFSRQIKDYDRIEKIVVANGFRGKDINSMPKMLGWYFSLFRGVFTSNLKKRIRKLKNENNVVALVHGDTNTTVVGCLLGLYTGISVGHVEAGLRSGSLRHPFPEELNRRIAAKLCKIHFPPGEASLKALKEEHTKGDIVFTEANTACDSIKWALGQKVEKTIKINRPYAIASIHRTELLYGTGSKKRVSDFLEKLNELSKDVHITFIDYPTTKNVIETMGLDEKMKGIQRLPKQDYKSMIQLLGSAEYILTDSGGFQEDSYYLGVPCIIHRMRTERDEGLGKSAELDYYDLDKIQPLLDRFKRQRPTRLLGRYQPTKIICTYLKDNNYISSFDAPR